MLSYRMIETRAGYVGIVASARGLRRVFLPEPRKGALRRAILDAFADATEDPQLMPELATQLEGYFAGEAVRFRPRIDWSGHTSFEMDAWRACSDIGYGETSTYKRIADLMRNPGATRAVGTAMSHNPFPIVVPCHRVLRSDGGLGGYSGPGGVAFKRRLLDMEAQHAPAQA